MLNYDFHDSVGYWLTVAQQAYFRAVTDAIEPYGITFRQAQVLGLLALEGPLSQCELANHMMIEPATLVGVLDRMQRDGWVERVPCPEDRRKNMIRPLPAAEEAWSKIVDCALTVRQQAREGLTDADLAELRRVLDRISLNLGHHPAAASASTGCSAP